MVLIGLTGCKSTSIIPASVKTHPAQDSNLITGQRKLPERIWVKKMSGEIRINETQKKFKGHLRLVKDSLMIAGIQSALGIEALRIFITRDSVLIINRVDRRFYHQELLRAQNEISAFVGFEMLQKILLSDAGSLLGEDKTPNKENTKAINEDQICLETDGQVEHLRLPEGSYGLSRACFWKRNEMLSEVNYRSRYGNVLIAIEYPEYQKVENYLLANNIKFNVLKENREAFGLDLILERIETNTDFPVTIRIASTYKRVENISDL